MSGTEMARLEAVGLECVRSDRKLFSDLNFSLESGQTLLIEGANGSGKTSLLRILCGLSLASEGEVRWGGEDIVESRAEYLAELVYVAHASGIKNELTALENLQFENKLNRQRDGITPMTALDKMGIGQHAYVPCGKLSAGQRRRVALARLLMRDARLWILDEPLTALDKDTVIALENTFVEHVSSGGMLIMTTHRHIELGDTRVKNITL